MGRHQNDLRAKESTPDYSSASLTPQSLSCDRMPSIILSGVVPVRRRCSQPSVTDSSEQFNFLLFPMRRILQVHKLPSVLVSQERVSEGVGTVTPDTPTDLGLPGGRPALRWKHHVRGRKNVREGSFPVEHSICHLLL